MIPLIFSTVFTHGIYFDNNHHALSKAPLVGKTNHNPSSLATCNALMHAIHTDLDGKEREYLTFEVLAKVFAYRPLEKGDIIYVPQETHLAIYHVDCLFDLWQGMPAFGLVSKTAPPILLFRGTVGKATKAGIASLLNDADPGGPGYHLYKKRALPLIQAFVNSQKMPVIVVGFSLGASLGSYTIINQHERILKGYLFNHPGLQRRLLKRWQALKQKPPVFTFLNKGDLVSSLGGFIGEVYRLDLKDQTMNLYEAHSHLMFVKPHCIVQKGYQTDPLGRSYNFEQPQFLDNPSESNSTQPPLPLESQKNQD